MLPVRVQQLGIGCRVGGCCDLNDGRPAWTLAGFFRERSLWPIPDNRRARRRLLREHRSVGTRSSDAAEAGSVIRKHRAGEERKLAELHVECWRQTYSRLLPPDYFSQDPVGERLPMSQNIVATSAERPAVVAEQDDLLIGFALAGAPIHPDPLRLLQLYSLLGVQ